MRLAGLLETTYFQETCYGCFVMGGDPNPMLCKS